MRTFPALALVLAWTTLASAAPPPAADVQDIVYLGDSRPLLIRLHIRIDGKPFRTAWEDSLRGIFALLDTNHDGFLDRAEAERIPSGPALFSTNPFFAGPPLRAALDYNGDGKISPEELVRHYRESGATPFHLVMDQSGGMSGSFTFVADGGVYRSAGGSSSSVLTQRLFALLDTDRDGKLSARELEAAPTVLGKLDANDDEMVTSNELQGQPGDGMASNVFFAAAPPRPMPNPSGGPFLEVEPGKADRALGRRLLAHYGSKAGKPAGKTLSREDLGLPAEAFTQLDEDKNGSLDVEELARLPQRPADLEFLVRMGKTSKDEAYLERVGAGKLTRQVRRAVDGMMSFDLGPTRLQLSRIDSDRDSSPSEQIRLQYKVQFQAADQDKNGYLDAGEAQRNAFFQRQFKKMDRNGDGKVFEKEMLAYLEEAAKLQDLAARSRVSLQVRDEGQGLFRLIDSNGDGRLSLREMRQMSKLGAELDRDGDGKISSAEVPRTYRLAVTRVPAQMQQAGGRFVVQLQGGMPQPPQEPPGQGPTWFRKMDRNGDGDVSRREFLGSAEHFRAIDTDGDGLISLEEARKADAVLRKGPAPGPSGR